MPNYPHHVVQRGNNRQKIFHDQGDLHVYFRLLKKLSEKENVLVKSYCFMPNHIHLLLVPTEHECLAKMMKRLNVSYALYINRKYTRTGGLFDGRFFSAVVADEHYLWSVCRYIETNPVRSGMVGKPTEYFWSSARFHMGISKSDLIKRPVWVTASEKNAYRELLSQALDQNIVRTISLNTNRNKFLGSIPSKR